VSALIDLLLSGSASITSPAPAIVNGPGIPPLRDKELVLEMPQRHRLSH